MRLRQFVPSSLAPAARIINQTAQAHFRQAQYAAAQFGRTRRLRQEGFEFRTYPEVAAALHEHGFAVIPDVIRPYDLAALRDELEAALAARLVYPIRRNPQVRSQPEHLTANEVGRGEDYIARHANISYVRDPLVTCPSTLGLVFSDLLIDIAVDFYGGLPAVTGCNLMKSYVNDLPEAGFNLFHSDCQSAKFIKFFIYLDDVHENAGPFCIVSGSHRKKPVGWRINNNRTIKDIERDYGQNAVRRLTARAGDLIVANTTAFHRAEKPQGRVRRALMINTGVHNIRRAIGTDPTMLEEQFRSLTPKQKCFADFIQVSSPTAAN